MHSSQNLTRTQRSSEARTKCHGNTLACKIMHNKKHPLFIERIESAYNHSQERLDAIIKEVSPSLWQRIKSFITSKKFKNFIKEEYL